MGAPTHDSFAQFGGDEDGRIDPTSWKHSTPWMLSISSTVPTSGEARGAKGPPVTRETLAVDLGRVVAEATVEELPVILGRLEAAKAAAWVRLMVPRPESSPAVPDPCVEMLTAEQAAEAIGGVSLKWLYRHTRGLRFRRDLSRKVVRFERAGLLRWIAAKRA